MGVSAVATRRAESAFGVADVAGLLAASVQPLGPVTAGGQRTEPLPTTFCIAGTAGDRGRRPWVLSPSFADTVRSVSDWPA